MRSTSQLTTIICLPVCPRLHWLAGGPMFPSGIFWTSDQGLCNSTLRRAAPCLSKKRADLLVKCCVDYCKLPDERILSNIKHSLHTALSPTITVRNIEQEYHLLPARSLLLGPILERPHKSACWCCEWSPMAGMLTWLKRLCVAWYMHANSHSRNRVT